MNFNQKLRQKMEEKGPEAAIKWNEQLQENALEFNAIENKKAEELVKDFKKQRKLLVSR